MSRAANPVAVGAFVLGALGLALGGVIALGGLDLFAENPADLVIVVGCVDAGNIEIVSGRHACGVGFLHGDEHILFVPVSSRKLFLVPT